MPPKTKDPKPKKTKASNKKKDDEEEELPKPKELWGDSKSKGILRRGLIDRTIDPCMEPKEVWKMHEEHMKWPWRNWKPNYERLRDAITRERNRMAEDSRDFGKDKAIVMKIREGELTPWHKTKCPELLKEDIDKGRHYVDPIALRESRPEYKQFTLTVFRKHVHQEVASRHKRDLRFERKKLGWKYPELHEDHPRLQANK